MFAVVPKLCKGSYSVVNIPNGGLSSSNKGISIMQIITCIFWFDEKTILKTPGLLGKRRKWVMTSCVSWQRQCQLIVHRGQAIWNLTYIWNWLNIPQISTQEKEGQEGSSGVWITGNVFPVSQGWDLTLQNWSEMSGLMFSYTLIYIE